MVAAGDHAFRRTAFAPVSRRNSRTRSEPEPLHVAAPQFGYVARPSRKRPVAGTCAPMSQLLSLLNQFDSFCGQLSAAIQGAQTQLYAMLALVVVAVFFAFPPKDDPDQI